MLFKLKMILSTLNMMIFFHPLDTLLRITPYNSSFTYGKSMTGNTESSYITNHSKFNS